MSDLCQVLGPVEINGRALRVGRRERNTGEPKSTPNDVELAGRAAEQLLARGLTQQGRGGGETPRIACGFSTLSFPCLVRIFRVGCLRLRGAVGQ